MNDEQDLKQEIMAVDERINAVIVNDAESYATAGTLVIALDQLKRKINDYWNDPITKAFQVHKSLTAKRAEMLQPVDERRKSLTKKISEYLTLQEQIKREEQRALDEARRIAEQKERERLEKLAIKAEEKGNAEKAEILREKAEDVYIPPAIVIPEVEKTTRLETGTASQKKDIAVKVTDEKLVLKEIVDGRLPIGIITISVPKLKQAIRLTGLKQVPGCTITEIVSASFRSK